VLIKTMEGEKEKIYLSTKAGTQACGQRKFVKGC
jgi:hypothetical protein